MKPEQARQILTEAADYIGEWKEKLLVVPGNGIDIKDSSAGQVVLMGGPPGKAPLEPEELYVYLWARYDLTMQTTRYNDPNYGLLDPGTTTTYSTEELIVYNLDSLEAGEYSNKEAYGDPDARYQPEGAGAISGYTSLVYGGWQVLPTPPSYGWIGPVPEQYPPFGAVNRPQYLSYPPLQFSPEFKGFATIKFYVRAFTKTYVDYILSKGQKLQFAKGVGVGNYDLIVRQIGSKQGPSYTIPAYTDEFGTYYPPSSTFNALGTSESRTVRVGFVGNEVSFSPQALDNPYFESPGTIEIVAYRKV